MYVCMYACMYVCMYVCMCVYVYIYIYINTTPMGSAKDGRNRDTTVLGS